MQQETTISPSKPFLEPDKDEVIKTGRAPIEDVQISPDVNS